MSNNKQQITNNKLSKTSYLLVFYCSLFFAFGAHAQTTFILPPLGGVAAKSPDTLIHLLYFYSLALAGLAGFSAFLYGGIVYLTAAGNPGKAEEAKDRLIHALLGLMVVVFSGVTLRFINPDFFKFNPLSQINSPAGAPILPPLGLVGPGYLSCQPQGAAGNFCTPITTGATCGEDEQCAPCIGLAVGAACTPVSQGRSDFEYIACVPDLPCLTAQGGSCPSNYPCSNITGGISSDWQVAPDGKCQDPERPLECVDEAAFNPTSHVCCSRNPTNIAAAPSAAGTLTATCYANPNPAQANLREGVNFGIKANGSGNYDCRWSGSFDAIGCNPEHVFPLPGTYQMQVEIRDLGTGQRTSAACAAIVEVYPFDITNLRTNKTALTGVQFCPDDPWRINFLSPANPIEPVYVKVWKNGVLIQDWKMLEQVIPPPLDSYTGSMPTYTDADGAWISQGQFKPDLIAAWQIQTSVRGVESGIMNFDVKPCMRLTDLATGAVQNTILYDPNFAPMCVEDPWKLEVIGPADADVWIQRTFNGSVWVDWTNFGRTDASGHWSVNGNHNRCLLGDWIERARLTDADGIEQFSDDLIFSIKPCLNAVCSNVTVAQGLPPTFTMQGTVTGDRDLYPLQQVDPREFHECTWIGPGAITQPIPSPGLCSQTPTIFSANIAPGSYTVTLRARDVVYDCSGQNFPHPQPATPNWTDATCALNVCSTAQVVCSGQCYTPVCLQTNPSIEDSMCNDGLGCTLDLCVNGRTCASACNNQLKPNQPEIVCGTGSAKYCMVPECTGSSQCSDNNDCTQDICQNPSSCQADCDNPPVPGTHLICMSGTCTSVSNTRTACQNSSNCAAPGDPC